MTATLGSSATDQYEVVIVGGGVAGLFTAHLLKKRTPKAKIVVLEAASRLGGRIFTKDGFAPWPVDLGGEFIHGEKTLHKKICDEFGLKQVRTFCSLPPHPYFPGRVTCEYVWLPLERLLISWTDLYRTDADFRHLLNELALLPEAGKNSECSVMTHLVSRGVAQRMLSLADSVYAKTWSGDLSTLKASACANEDGKDKDTGHDNYIIENGGAAMLEIMATGVEVRLNSCVTSISRIQKHGVSLVRLRDGTEVAAKRVVLATPMTSFQKGGIDISPAVPITEGAQASEMGKAVKLILMFNKSFWPSHMLFVFCSDSIVSQMWMDPPRTQFPQCHVITGYITGSQAGACHKWPTWQIVDAFLKQLDLMFATKETKRPAYENYEDHILCNWVTFPFIHGSYTSPGWGDCSTFSQLHHDGALAFVGEHVAAPGWEIATINGAMESARATVERWHPAPASKL